MAYSEKQAALVIAFLSIDIPISHFHPGTIRE